MKFLVKNAITGTVIGRAHETQAAAEQAAIRAKMTVSLDIVPEGAEPVSFVAEGTVYSMTEVSP
jgi:hypothetical protein